MVWSRLVLSLPFTYLVLMATSPRAGEQAVLSRPTPQCGRRTFPAASTLRARSVTTPLGQPPPPLRALRRRPTAEMEAAQSAQMKAQPTAELSNR